MLVLNIGLHTNNGTRPNAASEVLGAIRADGYATFRTLTTDSDTEPTLVVELDESVGNFNVREWLSGLCLRLNQDCIAAYDTLADQGILRGPKPWGDFNPEFFILLDGRRLSETDTDIPVPAAA